MILLLVLLLFCFPCFSEEGSPDSSLLIVHVPAVDLRREPVPAKKNDFSHDPLQETQLFYGEKVKVLEQKNGWSRVEALEQLEWTHHEKWEGYPGWVRSDHLTVTPPSGWEPDQVITAPTAEIREKPEEDAPVLLRLFLGARIVGAQLIAPL
ncbi:MAG: hypothetical protein HYS56_01660, partial [Candidatus Omnitrophica bacterium]|nr:hypothetical protein [Candidatus Omnitrophota bacterium]